VYPENFEVVPMGKYEGCGATPYYLLESLVLILGVVGGFPLPKI